jgi:methylmalonyl-CoA/ethylmalonyl-CoA epimerase
MVARGIHHVGVAVDDLDAAVATYERLLGGRLEHRERGPGMHHVAYEVDDVDAALDELAKEGAELIDTAPRRGMFGLEVAFVHPDSVHGVLSEVVSRG